MNFNSLRSKVVRTVSPALCVGMLLGAARLQRGWPAAAAARAFHEHAVAAVAAIPLTIDGWSGRDVDPPPAAIEVATPNVVRTIEYLATRRPAGDRDDDRVWLDVTECRRAGDMLGHFPPKCYPAYGDTLLETRPRNWMGSSGTGAKAWIVRGVEYRFERVVAGRAYRRTVYDFMIAPGRGILSDMKDLNEAAEDYRRRYFGAAQVQVVFVSPAGQEPDGATRDAIFSTLMRAAGPAIEVLRRGE